MIPNDVVATIVLIFYVSLGLTYIAQNVVVNTQRSLGAKAFFRNSWEELLNTLLLGAAMLDVVGIF